MQIKKISKNDLDQLVNISLEQFKNESWSNEQYSEAYNDNNYVFLGCFDNEKLLSFLVANESTDDVNILMLATSENDKREGYAKELIKYLQNYVKKHNKTFFLMA